MKIKMVGYINPKLVEYNYPLDLINILKLLLISLVKKNSSLEFSIMKVDIIAGADLILSKLRLSLKQLLMKKIKFHFD